MEMNKYGEAEASEAYGKAKRESSGLWADGVKDRGNSFEGVILWVNENLVVVFRLLRGCHVYRWCFVLKRVSYWVGLLEVIESNQM